MNTYIGSNYGAIITEQQLGGGQLQVIFSWSSSPAGTPSALVGYRALPSGAWVNSAGSPVSPRSIQIAGNYGDYEYRIQFPIGGGLYDTVTFTVQSVATNNFLYIPELNPLIFWEKNKTQLPTFFTKFMEDYEFSLRGYYWQDKETYCQPWQDTDIIYLQMASSFSPLVVQIKNEYGDVILQRSANGTIPHLYIADLFIYEFQLSLAGLQEGCYVVELLAGYGAYQKVYYTWHIFISNSQLDNTFLIKYKSSKKVFKDVMFNTGIEFQLRVPGCFGFLNKVRKDEIYRDQQYNSTLVNSKSAKQYPVSFGDEFGLPDDMINLIDEIFSCDIVRIDERLFGIAERSKIEYVEAKRSRRRGMRMTLEDGLNRHSRINQTLQDPTKRLVATAMVSPKVWGVQTGSNVIPVTNIE